MSLLKQLKWNLILLAVIFIALGIVLILWPGATFSGYDERYYENAEFGRYASPRTWYMARGVCDGNCKYCCRNCTFDESV